MKTAQVRLDLKNIKEEQLQKVESISPNLVIVFWSGEKNSDELAVMLKKRFSKATVVGCSTAGEISSQGVSDDHAVVTGVRFEKSAIRHASSKLESMERSADCGKKLGKLLIADDLKGVLVFAQGININGSALVDGLQETVGNEITITGGLAGDGTRFGKTYTILNGNIKQDEVVALGFYGSSVKINFGSMGGW